MYRLTRGTQFLYKTCVHNATRRRVANESKTWEKRYKKSTRTELENYWRKIFKEKWDNRPITTIDESERGKFYCLSMFPYPSGKLHMGHVRVYTISDTFAHFYRMNGYKVIHPMGWDAFGLPAENAARDRKLDPREWTQDNMSYMKKQLDDLNFTFDWEREVTTCHSDYYKWTQYIFIKMFNAGLAYQKQALVNWDPVDKTVLADEQVDENGCSWRSGAKVEKKYLKQWFLKTSQYAQSLLDSLHEIDENVGIKAMQKHWIGKIDGSFISFPLHVKDKFTFSLPVFCSHPEAVCGASHVVIQALFKEELAHQLKNPKTEHLKSQLLSKNEPGVLTDSFVINPFNNKKLPLLLGREYEDKFKKVTTVLGIPDKDKVAKVIAEQENFQYDSVISGDEVINSGKFSGPLEKAREKILKFSHKFGYGNGQMTSSSLHDWLISRQRYWGTPIPIVHCPVHGPVPVSLNELPVKLPVINYRLLQEESPLSSATTWNTATCPRCALPSKRETDTMDTFVDSSWYYLRYTDPGNTRLPFSRFEADRTMPVDLYIGGKEHAILHLYFARFFNHFLADQKMVSHREPFKKILAQGVIKGQTYQVESTGKYLQSSEVDLTGDEPVVKETGEKVKATFQKMSKSKLNGIDPEEFVSEWGISITRLYLLYAASPLEDICWDVKTDIIPGVMRWQLKVWTCVTRLLDARNGVSKGELSSKKLSLSSMAEIEELCHAANKTIRDVTDHFTKDCVLSAAVTCLMTLSKLLTHISDEIVQYSPDYERAVCALVIMTAPMVPHFASELWSGLRLMEYKLTDQDWEKEVLQQRWPYPCFNTDFNLVEYKIRVDRQTCHAIRLPSDLICDSEKIKSTVLSQKKVKKRMRGAKPEHFDIDSEKCEISISTTS